MHWFIDDERDPVFSRFMVFRNQAEIKDYFRDAMYVFDKYRVCLDKIDGVSFDHDLGENEPTGYDILKMLINEHHVFLSDNLHIYVHSQNPIGKENILKYAENYKRVFGTNWTIER